jgi:hypothetical protein
MSPNMMLLSEFGEIPEKENTRRRKGSGEEQ